jgi:hypothetical protein
MKIGIGKVVPLGLIYDVIANNNNNDKITSGIRS